MYKNLLAQYMRTTTVSDNNDEDFTGVTNTVKGYWLQNGKSRSGSYCKKNQFD